MNEPAGYSSSSLLAATRQYWYDSYGNIRQNGGLVEVIHDAFQALTYWNGVMPSSGYSNVMMDTHHYEIFSDAEEALTYPQHISVRSTAFVDCKGTIYTQRCMYHLLDCLRAR